MPIAEIFCKDPGYLVQISAKRFADNYYRELYAILWADGDSETPPAR
jgi:hypothetical protein